MYLCPVRKFNKTDIKDKSVKHYSGFVYDVTTTTGYFIIRRNNKVSVSGNCELHPFYMPNNKWNHGFARIKVNEDGTFKVFNPRIYNGQIL